MTDEVTHEGQSFIDYWNAVDAALLARCFIDTWDAGLDADELAAAQEDGWTPDEYAAWFVEKYALDRLP